ncbi:hypothetical protein DFH08DRAFT_807319 [Mycena albidolilacea]|uniref:F-box domain-containing protein n=1 Tax=Mycena albidolilacea TaxID=1033008 RepID=A0AAD7EUD0_9AGAR|nr:hypothetical protein DFH08DRAFT_807319 [Mycena albidolilacea]
MFIGPSHTLDIIVDTVSVDDHIPGVTLCRDEMREIFALITPHVVQWRAFHLKVRANECKLIARQALSTCGPAPRLETLQLYHFEEYRTTQNLYIATYRPLVVIFDNVLPALKNVSLVAWKHAPYLQHLHALELARHPDNIRPPFKAWDAILRRSPRLRRLRLHYSAPCAADEHNLDPDHLTRLLHTLELPRLTTLALDLPEQDFAAVPEQDLTGMHSTPCASLRSNSRRPRFELDFSHIRDPEVICGVLLETIALPLMNTDAEETRTTCECEDSRRAPVLLWLEETRLFGLAGERMRRLIAFRAGFAEGRSGGSGFPVECGESLPSSACSSSSSSTPWLPEDSTPTLSRIIIGSEVDFSSSRCGRAVVMPRPVVQWSARRCICYAVLEQLVRQGRVECVDEDDGADNNVSEGYDSSKCGDELNGPSDEEEESGRA